MRIDPIPADHPPAAVEPLYDAVRSALGTVPMLMQVVGNSPAALEGYLGFNGALADPNETSLIFSGGQWRTVDADADQRPAFAQYVIQIASEASFAATISLKSPGLLVAMIEAIPDRRTAACLGMLMRNAIHAALTSETSWIYRESERFSAGHVGRERPVSRAVFGTYSMVEGFDVALDQDFTTIAQWPARRLEAFCEGLLLTVENYVAEGWQEHSFALFRAFHLLEFPLFQLSALNDRNDPAYEEVYERFRVIIRFARSVRDLLQEHDYGRDLPFILSNKTSYRRIDAAERGKLLEAFRRQLTNQSGQCFRKLNGVWVICSLAFVNGEVARIGEQLPMTSMHLRRAEHLLNHAIERFEQRAKDRPEEEEMKAIRESISLGLDHAEFSAFYQAHADEGENDLVDASSWGAALAMVTSWDLESAGARHRRDFTVFLDAEGRDQSAGLLAALAAQEVPCRGAPRCYEPAIVQWENDHWPIIEYLCLEEPVIVLLDEDGDQVPDKAAVGLVADISGGVVSSFGGVDPTANGANLVDLLRTSVHSVVLPWGTGQLVPQKGRHDADTVMTDLAGCRGDGDGVMVWLIDAVLAVVFMRPQRVPRLPGFKRRLIGATLPALG